MISNQVLVIPFLSVWIAVVAVASIAVASTDVETNTSEENSEQLQAILAMEADSEFGAYLVGECLTCHTPGSANGNIPQIHGKDKAYLASALLAYKNGQRDNDVMRGVVSVLSDDEIAAISTYLSES